MAFYNEIKKLIFSNIQFMQMDKEKDSYYPSIGSVLIRVSNHCTHMKKWEQYFEQNPKLRRCRILSLVFEDNTDTFTQECLFQVSPNIPRIEVDEYVYKIHGDGAFIKPSDIKLIVKALRNMLYGNYFKDPTNKGEYFHWLSFMPDYNNIEITPDGRAIPAGFNGVDYPIEETKLSKYMKQNKTTITEAELKNIIAESIKKVLNEKYNPWQRKETENGVIFPRYDADTAKYRKNVVNQASHLYKQIEYFLQTLSHAYPSGSDSFNRTMGARGEEELEAILEQAKSALESYCRY